MPGPTPHPPDRAGRGSPPDRPSRGPRRACLQTALTSLVALTGALLVTGVSLASPIGYWRMEVDNDPTAGGLSVPNELAFGTSLLSSEAQLDGSNLPVGVIPLTFSSNQFSAAATQQGGANGINASAAWYPELAVASITVEYWARTVEGTATPFRMSSGGQDGIVITNPNALTLTYYVDDAGTTRAYTLNNLDDMGSSWRHYAFAYDHITGISTFYVDGATVASFDGPDNAPLVILNGTSIEVGVVMDYASAGQGTVDELKIDGTVLGPMDFLVPEPSAGTLTALGFAVLALGRRPGRRQG